MPHPRPLSSIGNWAVDITEAWSYIIKPPSCYSYWPSVRPRTLGEQAAQRERPDHRTTHSSTRPSASPESTCFPSGAQATAWISGSSYRVCIPAGGLTL